MRRLFLSKIINALLNKWLNLNLTDYTDGFRLYNREAVEFLSKVKLREKGFIVLSKVAYRLKQNNFKIIEEAVSFTERKHGKSSAGFREYIASIIGIIRIRFIPVAFKK